MIVLTGGSGFVGLNVAEQLLARGDAVLIFDLRPPPPFFSNAIFVQGDVSEPETVAGIFKKYSATHVIHMSAITAGPERDAREPRRIAEVNLIGTLNVLEAAKASGVRRFVHASTGALYGAAGMGVPEPLDEELPALVGGVAVDDQRERVHLLTGDEHVDARDVALAEPGEVVVEAGVSPCA